MTAQFTNFLVSFLYYHQGDNQSAKWLLLQRVKGKEYEASFSNARAVVSHNLVAGNSFSTMDIDDIICTVDDIAEGAGEIAALATLMYAPIPIQDCLSSGSVNRLYSSVQCTLENLRPFLQRFPTLWRALTAACFGQDPTCSSIGPKPKCKLLLSNISRFVPLNLLATWKDLKKFSSDGVT